jgi:hypothetical protein
LFKRSTYYFLLLWLLLAAPLAGLYAQTPGINVEMVARDTDNNPAKKRKIFLRLEVIPGAITNPPSYIEEIVDSTDDAGIFSVVLGKGTRIGGTFASVLNIPWSAMNYSLRVRAAIVPILPITNWNYQNEFRELGVTPFGIVPYAGYARTAESVTASAAVISFSGGTTGLTPATASTGDVVLSGVLSIANGGTGSGVRNFVDLTSTETIGGLKTFSQLLSALNGVAVSNGLSLAGTTSPIRLNGNAGTAGQVLISQGAGTTPTWVSAQQAAGIKTKGRSTLLSGADTYDIALLAGLPSLDENDGISVVLEAGTTPMPVPNFYIFRDIINNRVTIHFTAPFSGYVTWVIID